MKVLSVVGTRPNFVKELLVNQEMQARGHRQVLVHTGQHYDYEMSRIFFQELGLPDPDYHLQVNNCSGTHQTAEMLTALDDILEIEKPDVTLVYGDVNSTLAGALLKATTFGWPLIIAGLGKAAYDLTLLARFGRRASARGTAELGRH